VVELALMLPVLLLITVGMIDLSRGFSAWIALSNGVREAALYASKPPNYDDTTTIRSRVIGEAAGLDLAALTIDAPTCDGGACGESSTSVSIHASYQFDLIVPVLMDLFPAGITLSADATAPIIDYDT
jgi:Flp pilus assembly protein TadG